MADISIQILTDRQIKDVKSLLNLIMEGDAEPELLAAQALDVLDGNGYT